MSFLQGRRLVIEAEALTGRWSLTDPVRRDCAAWPPAPDTLFCALVAAAAARGEACDPALRWLETRGAPIIEYEAAAGRTNGFVTYAPVADRTMFSAGWRQRRSHSSIGSNAPVRWSWMLDEGKAVPLEPLSVLAAGVTHVGSPRGSVLARAFVTADPLGPEALVPIEGGPHRLRVPHPGRLDALEAAFRSGRRPPLGPSAGYAPLKEIITAPDGAPRLRGSARSWGDLLALRRKSGPILSLDAVVPLMEAARRALLHHLGDGAPAALTGDGPECGRVPHLAFVPLARVGDPHATGEIAGLGLLPPAGLAEAEMFALAGAVGRWLQEGGRLQFGPLAWHLASVTVPQLPWSLNPTRYDSTASLWTSVTPVVLDRHPKRHADGRLKRGRSVPEIVEDMCLGAGLPRPQDVRWRSGPFLQGAMPAREHALGQRGYLSGAHLLHLQIAWDQPVRGPVLLGRGRYFGLGLMVPGPQEASRADAGDRSRQGVEA